MEQREKRPVKKLLEKVQVEQREKALAMEPLEAQVEQREKALAKEPLEKAQVEQRETVEEVQVKQRKKALVKVLSEPRGERLMSVAVDWLKETQQVLPLD